MLLTISMKKLSYLFFALSLAAAAAGPRVFTGVITDSMCGDNHKPMKVSPDSKCVRECVRMDKTFKYALYDGKKMYVLSDQQTPEKFAAQKVKITGVLHDKTNILEVNRIEPVR